MATRRRKHSSLVCFFVFVCLSQACLGASSLFTVENSNTRVVSGLLSSVFYLLSFVFYLLSSASSCSGWHEDQSVGLIDPDAAGDGDGTGGDEDGGATLARSRSAKLSAKAGFTIIEKTEVRRRRNALSLSLSLFRVLLFFALIFWR